MPILGILFFLFFAALIFGPGLWTKWVLRKHGKDRPDYPGTGGELARHLLDGYNLEEVRVEAAPPGQDHYDPMEKVVRLSPEHLEGRSLTAVAVAAHEVGHAIQDRDDYKPLKRRTQLIMATRHFERIGIITITVASFASIFLAGPFAIALWVFGLVMTGLIQVVVQISTLPVEIDASFNRALPILKHGKFIPEKDLEGANEILKACAYTYVAAALRSIIDLLRYIRR